MRTFIAVAAAASLIFASACSGNAGMPTQPGQYSVQKDSVHFDGDRYELYYADSSGTIHNMKTRSLKMLRDPERTYLEIPQGGGDPVLHLREDEPITVDGRDNQGAFSSPWFPFFLGTMVGNTFGGRGQGTVVINNPAPGERGTYGPDAPTYRYPPTGTFGRDDSLHGSLDSSKPQSPDYSKVQPAPYATTGTSSGTGGGAAASNKAPSVSGSAASSKGGFSSGSQAYSAPKGVGGGTGSSGAVTGKPSTGKPSTGISGGKGIGGSRAPTGRR
jgi:hypothetical protein